MDKNNVTLLDCTFRDGGYYNDWNFNKKLRIDYLKNIFTFGVDVVEIGFRFSPKKFYLGPYAYSKDEILNKYLPKSKRFAVMINANELIKINSIKFFLNKKNKSKISIVRIACQLVELKKIKKFFKPIKNLGYKVILNIMQISEYSENEMLKKLKYISQDVDVVYFADSLGSLEPKDIKKISKFFLKNLNQPIGLHAHDNLGFALKNCVEAIKNGVTWIDGTMSGMGRGAGNVKTENLVKYLSKFSKKYKINSSNKKLIMQFEKLKSEYKWGKSKLYELAARKSIHPTYVQTMLNSNKLSNYEIQKIFNKMTHLSLRRFDFDKLNSLYQLEDKANFEGKWNAKNFLESKDVLIIANTDQTKEHKRDICQFIKRTGIVSLSLNFSKYISGKFIHYYIFSHYDSFLTDGNYINNISNKVILPKKRFENFLNRKIRKKNTLDYGYKIKENKFCPKSNYAIIPNNLAFSYALSLCNIGKAKNVYLVGFDGHKNNNKKFLEMVDTINIINKNKNKNINLVSLLPSSYPLTESSIYA